MAFIKTHRSIKNQVITFMVIGITLMTVVISLVTTTGVNQQYQQLMLKNAFQITEVLAKQAVFPLLSGSEQNAQEAMNQVQGFQAVLAARLLTETQQLFLAVGDYPKLVTPVEPFVQQTDIIAETTNYWLIKTPIKLSANSPLGEENQFELDTNNTPEQIIGYAEIVYSKEYLIEAQNQLTLLISVVGALSVILLSAVLHFGLHKLFKPLGDLASTMQLSENTGKHLLAQVNGAKEIQDMANIYNSMMKSLQQQETDLKSHRNLLEKEVEIRTRELVVARDTALMASRHKSEFMANMSHELRTPIQSIIGYSELVTEELELAGNFTLIDDMDKITKNAQRLLFMINSLLDLAKIEAGKIEIKETQVNVNDILISIRDTITPLAQANHNQFICHNNCSLKTITLDKTKLEQVLLNLLSNACKFTKNGTITFTIFCEEANLLFEIKDTGIGLSPEQQAYIFDEFRQVDASQARKFSGTGLGLSISKRFVELMQGKITVSSQLQQGSTFIVSLPIKQIA